jgi:hypothetical protein
VSGVDGRQHQVLDLRPLRGTWRARSDPSANAIGKADLIPYLTTPAEHQISLIDT